MASLKSFITTLGLLFFIVFWTSNSLAISIPKEMELEKKFMEMIKKKQMLLKDPIANHLVNQIGSHILSLLPPQPFKYSFYVVNDDVFNAFAAPGANIFAYRGLITALDSVDELAGIIGHEIAHAVSRHVSESIDRSKYITIGSLAGVIAGAIIGSKSNVDAGQTLITGSLALGKTGMLAFTRENETEADEKGIMFLKKSCFSPDGLLSGLNKIREADFRGVEGIPDYVKTHPGTGSRIAHAETILSGYSSPKNKPECQLDFDFDMVKYRLLGLYADIDPTFSLLTAKLLKDPENAALHFGIGLIYARKQRKQKAISHLKKALAIRMFDPMILLDLGRTYLQNGDPKKALNVLSGMETVPVIGLMARFYQANANLELNNYTKAERGYRAVINKARDTYPKAYFNLAKIKSFKEEQDLSHYYLGIYYAQIANYKLASFHLKKAMETLTDPVKTKDAKKRLEKIKKTKNSGGK
ncbi:MAG: M48 family metalloprotease [Desulfobacula sp.]|nr:M48 family metalloprotease [Desulfobacula sp.]